MMVVVMMIMKLRMHLLALGIPRARLSRKWRKAKLLASGPRPRVLLKGLVYETLLWIEDRRAVCTFENLHRMGRGNLESLVRQGCRVTIDDKRMRRRRRCSWPGRLPWAFP